MGTSDTTASHDLEQRRIKRLQNRMALCAGGGEACDGWVLGVTAAALPLARSDLGLSSLQTGLIGSAALIGIFFGGLIFGWLTDRFGRQRMYLADLLVFLIGSLVQFVVTDGVQLFAVRLVMGIAVGADYAIAGALVAEFASPERRGRLLGSLVASWYIGYTAAASFGLALAAWSTNPAIWRWILASSAVVALMVLLARLGTPESPRWLASKGRTAEADEVSRRWLGHSIIEVAPDASPGSRSEFAVLLSPGYRRMTVFTSVFWLCQTTPFYAISVFAPQVMASLGIADHHVSEILLNVFLLVGCLAGVWLVDRTSRRALLIVPFVVAAGALFLLGGQPSGPQWVISLSIAGFALAHASSSTLQAVYPSEVFPTKIRATGLGFAAAASRIGGAVGTFLMPIGLDRWGITPIMFCGAALCLIGVAVSAAWAPETKGVDLSLTSAPHPGRR
ncbi:MFS transporter [Streptomyces sp. NPDC001941]|uniref:MFS transporter n=1 Tax=Streptomyces sp. NPDC001941 TaxID=3154659 RepID=UPI00331FD4D8